MAHTTTSPLTRGGHVRNAEAIPRMFLTTTPPRVTENTHIVAATHASLTGAAHHNDGWFIADFYAFNYLFRGLGASQSWLTIAVLYINLSLESPQNLIKRHGQYVHGNPYQDRKVVLSNKLLQDDRITPVTVVTPSSIIDRFLQEVSRASETAKRERGNVLLLVFCHGLEGHELVLDDTGKTTLSITRLKGALEPYVPVCLLTTACHSGGWTVCPDLNISTMTAAGHDTLSTSWPASESIGRFSGSVFVSSVIDSLSSATSELVTTGNDKDRAAPKAEEQEPTSMQPEKASAEQTKTYNEFCRSIWDACRAINRLWHHHEFTFSAHCDEWEAAWTSTSTIPLTHFKNRWNALETYPYRGSDDAKAWRDPSPQNPNFQMSIYKPGQSGNLDNDDDDDMFVGPLIESLYHNRIQQMVKLWLQTCPGEWSSGYETRVRGVMKDCSDAGRVTLPPDDDADDDEPIMHYNVAAIIQYRLNLAKLAENILATLDLPRPGGQSCLFWHRFIWEEDMAATKYGSVDHVRKQFGTIWKEMQGSGRFFAFLQPTVEQGPPFVRFQAYIVAALVEAQKPHDKTRADMFHILDMISSAARFYQQTARDDPVVQSRAREWFRSIGR